MVVKIIVRIFLIVVFILSTSTTIHTKELTPINKSIALVNFVQTRGRIPTLEAMKIVLACYTTHDPVFYLALTYVESTYNKKAVSRVGAVGLGQIMPNLHTPELIEKGIISERESLFTAYDNIKATEYIFSKMLKRRKNNYRKAIYDYLGTESESYYNKIMKTKRHIEGILL